MNEEKKVKYGEIYFYDFGEHEGSIQNGLRPAVVIQDNKERTYVRYVNGQKIKHTVTPVLGEKAPHNGKVVYSLDFQVTPHQLRHTYITNLIYAGVDPKTVQYLAGHENSKITMDIYAKVKYNSPDALSTIVNNAFNNMYAKAE